MPKVMRRWRAAVARGRGWGAAGVGLVVLVASAYLGLYYAMYRILPWQTSAGMAEALLATAGVPTPMPDETTHTARWRTAVEGAHPPARQLPTETSIAAARFRLRHGRLQEVRISSQLLPGEHPVLIYLPPGYDTTRRRYPVLYLLHGAPGSYTDWHKAAGIDKTMDALISLGRVRPMIVVMPDGNGGPFSDSEWADNGQELHAEEYLIREVVPYIDSHYRTLADRDQRAIGGLSTGGFGAVNITLHHPEVFGYALSLSANYLASTTWTGQDLWHGDQALQRFNSPLSYVYQLAPEVRSTLHIYLTVDPDDRDNNTAQETRQFDAVLTHLHVPHLTQYFKGGHSWKYWKTHIVDALLYLQRVMPPLGGTTMPHAVGAHPDGVAEP